MRKIISIFLATAGFIFIVLGLAYQYKDEIYMYYQNEVLKTRDNITIEKNEYYKDNDYQYVKNTNDFIAKDNEHLKDIFYTIINSGSKKFTFYCDEEYSSCTNDAVDMVNDENILSHINNFVHPFNSFNTINITYDEYGEINITVDKVYSDEEIVVLNDEVDKIISEKIKNDMSDEDKIKVIHDYIINKGKYATEKIIKKYPDKEFNKANDILIDGYGLCSAYTDAMALFLYEFGLDNYKIASDTHIWNLVNIDDEWLHLDLTWDDPVTQNGDNRLEIFFLLIGNDRLKELDTEKHNYDKKIYKEALNK